MVPRSLEPGANLPQVALDALADLVASLKQERIVSRVEYLPNGNIVCRWESGVWMATATIGAECQVIRLIACKETT